MADADAPGVISLNAYWFRDRPLEELRDEARDGYLFSLPGSAQVMKWHGGMPEPQHCLAHEFGHILRDAIPGAIEWAREVWEAATHNPADAISGYALAGPEEFFAEAFAAYRLGINHPHARLMGEFLSSRAGSKARVSI